VPKIPAVNLKIQSKKERFRSIFPAVPKGKKEFRRQIWLGILRAEPLTSFYRNYALELSYLTAK
jgi:hypothetical protein